MILLCVVVFVVVVVVIVVVVVVVVAVVVVVVIVAGVIMVISATVSGFSLILMLSLPNTSEFHAESPTKSSLPKEVSIS